MNAEHKEEELAQECSDESVIISSWCVCSVDAAALVGQAIASICTSHNTSNLISCTDVHFQRHPNRSTKSPLRASATRVALSGAPSMSELVARGGRDNEGRWLRCCCLPLQQTASGRKIIS